ncbi:MAG: retropepsin-like domain-containing protein [Clostridiales bacterium]|nr:retropepsin-like domain-containing protein [Clostridiales bacterium]
METKYSNVEINFKLVEGIILIPATVNDEQGYLAFDTGAMQTALHKKYYSDIQGNELEISKYSEGVKRETVTGSTIRSISFSDITLTDHNAIIMDLSYVEDPLAAADPSIRFLGTMGIDIIRNFSVILDYKNSKIILNPLCGFDKYTCVPLQMKELLVVEIEIGGKQYNFNLDTGANTCLLDARLIDQLPVQPVDNEPNVFNLSTLSLNNRTYSNVKSVFADFSAFRGEEHVDGIIGYHILSPQRSYFDFSNQKLYLEEV